MNLKRMCYFASTCLAIGTGAYADGVQDENQHDGVPHKSVFVYEIEWQVYCELNACAATEGQIWLLCVGGDLFLTAKEGVEIQHWYNRSAQPLPLTEPLDSFQVNTLLAEGKLVLLAVLGEAVVQIARISTPPIARFLEAMEPYASCVPPDGPNSYRLLLDDQQRANQNQNVSVNKPQVEFAIRSQTGAFE